MFWQGPLSLYEKACMASFVKQGFEVQVYAYHDLDLPAGVRWMPAQSILDQSLSTRFTQGGEKASPIAFSDLFRYQLLSTQGGIWADTDVFCLRPMADFKALQTQAAGKIIVAREDQDLINCAIMMTDSPHPLLAQMQQAAQAHQPELMEWGAIGPRMVTDFAHRYPQQMHVLPRESLYPIHYQDFAQALMPFYQSSCLNKTQGSYGLHLWNSLIRRCCIPKNILPPEGSYLHGLFRQVLDQELPALPAHTLQQLLMGTKALSKLEQIHRLSGDLN